MKNVTRSRNLADPLSPEKNLTSDTHPDTEKIYTGLLKRLSSKVRLQKTFEMSSWILQMSKEAISKAHPAWNKQRVDLFFVETHYGKSIALKLQRYLAKNLHEKS